jgi:MFS family permease
VLYFATNIFKGAGFQSSAALSSVGVGFVKLVATLFTVFRVDRYGRRILLLSGIAMMAVALLVLGTAFLFRECAVPVARMEDCRQDDVRLPQGWAICTVAALMLYVSGYQVGFGPISWLMISEIFPLNVRGAALSTAAVVNFSSNITMTLCQTALMSALTPAGLFYAYLVLSVVSFGFVKVVVPETKGKTLEEIEVLMTGKRRNAPSV